MMGNFLGIYSEREKANDLGTVYPMPSQGPNFFFGNSPNTPLQQCSPVFDYDIILQNRLADLNLHHSQTIIKSKGCTGRPFTKHSFHLGKIQPRLGTYEVRRVLANFPSPPSSCPLPWPKLEYLYGGWGFPRYKVQSTAVVATMLAGWRARFPAYCDPGLLPDVETFPRALSEPLDPSMRMPRKWVLTPLGEISITVRTGWVN